MKRNGKKSRKIKKLILTCALSAVVLIVSTYTWFIGIQTVRVSPFDIEIATTEGLFLSMDGESWVYNLDVNTAKTYTGNTNIMPGSDNKLVPLSTVGELDSGVSRMKFFEKSSFTTTPGGYRLLSTRVDNYSQVKDGEGKVTGTSQGSGYIVFDLFIKNLSGAAYYPDLQVKNEEAIYLTTDSSVIVDEAGGASQDKTGIENSVRVGFTQLGRVVATTTTASTITGITCSDSMEKDADGKPIVTGICRNAQIWEPNDSKDDHETNAITWFTKSCITRKEAGTDVTSSASYNVAQPDATPAPIPATYCAFPADYAKTYAIRDEIKITASSNDNVDIYDGHNGYSGSIYSATNTTGKLQEMDYFTDTEKDLKGTNRPQFMSLAPNSITKVRVYIWLEGQDLDNYDFAQLGKKVKINFGFTKERFTEDYDGDGTKDHDGPALVTSDNADIPTSVEKSE